MREITQDERKVFRNLMSGQFSNFGLLSTELDGIETYTIAALNGQEPNLTTKPLAVLINKEILQKLKPLYHYDERLFS